MTGKMNTGVLYLLCETQDDLRKVVHAAMCNDVKLTELSELGTRPHPVLNTDVRLEGRFTDLASLVEYCVPEDDEEMRVELIASIKPSKQVKR